MQIVIDIPESIWVAIQNGEYCGILDDRLYNAIKNGAPLPEHHGELIERDKVLKSLVDYVDGKKSLGQCIDDVPTIIEATDMRGGE